jgi:hypothetical protein
MTLVMALEFQPLQPAVGEPPLLVANVPSERAATPK